MTNYEAIVLRAARVADYLNHNKGAGLADAARALDCSYHLIKKGHSAAVRLGFIKNQETRNSHTKGMRPATLQRAKEISDYLNSHEGASIAETARALNYKQPTAYHTYRSAVRLNLIEKRNLRKGRRKGHLPSTLEKITRAVELKKQGLSLVDVGKIMGATNERVRQYLNIAERNGGISSKERADLNNNGRYLKYWAYFLELADRIEDINSETYHALAKKHWPLRKGNLCAAAIPIEKYCLETLVKNADPNDPDRFTEKDAEFIRFVLHRIKQSRLSLSELKQMANEYLTTDITLSALGIKYGVSEESCTNPAARGLYHLRVAQELNIVSRKDCSNKARKTRSEVWKKIGSMARKYPAYKIQTAIEARKAGIPYAEIARVLGMNKQTLSAYIYQNRKKQAENS